MNFFSFRKFTSLCFSEQKDDINEKNERKTNKIDNVAEGNIKFLKIKLFSAKIKFQLLFLNLTFNLIDRCKLIKGF